ncbi:MAG: hypothetical protein IPI49_33585 [Myxococcales bacterium]|nr:hypothetical protein [Myxococcales bacterium]
MRVEPSVTMPASLYLDSGIATVVDLSRSHMSFSSQGTWAAGDTVSGVLSLAGRTMPISGRIIRANEGRVTLELDAMADEVDTPLDGYLARAQLLDILL